ncbi:ribonuclease H2 subunit B isoform X2 [Paroedura picta]|uniref:ribonuclease H2 subunit B isoform X2 n=1 Tax=Paroedura picta TaxID=143630 RepID=UPI004056868A
MQNKKQRAPRPVVGKSGGDGGGQWVMVAPESAINPPKKAGNRPLFTQLRNPSTGQAALYLFSSDARQLFEVKAFHEEYRSWFIGQAVQQDGRLFFATPVDPLFFVLFYLAKAEEEQGKFQPLDQILVDTEFSACTMLLQCTDISKYIHHIAEEKETGRRKFYKYSEEKILKWLRKKVIQTVQVLKDHDVCVGGKVQSATFISSKKLAGATEEDYIRYAHGLISEYITEELSATLAKYLRLPEVAVPPKEPLPKKRKTSDAPVEAEEDYTKFNTIDLKSRKANKMSASQRALAKVDKSGMKAISSFFGSKSKAIK